MDRALSTPDPLDADIPDRGPLRVVVQQPSLAKYRRPFFRGLALRPGIDLKLVYGQLPGGPPNVDPDGFAAEPQPLRQYRIGSQSILWHGAQLQYATRDAADVLILSWNTRYVSLIPALLRARRNGVPTILWGHGYSKREAGWRATLREKVAGLATALLFYNHTAAQTYIDRGWDPKRIYVALNALDQAPIQAARQHWLDRPDELAAFQRQHRLDQGPMILFVSRFDAARRADLLIQAVAKMKDRHPKIQAVLIGKGEPEGQRLKTLAESLGVSDHIQFPGAIYGEQELAPWFLSSQVFCFPANIGLSLLHAFGYGLPVVTSDRTESQAPEIEALRDGENGLLYRHDDAESLAATLAHLLSDPDRRDRLSQAAHETATRRFTLENMVDGMANAIRYSATKIGNTLPSPLHE